MCAQWVHGLETVENGNNISALHVIKDYGVLRMCHDGSTLALSIAATPDASSPRRITSETGIARMLTDEQLDAMLMMLRNTTAIDRLNLAECRDVFRVLQVRGYTITAPPALRREGEPSHG